MFTFIKENSYLIVKMMLNQFGTAVFGLMLAMATSSNETLLLITSLFSVIFYLFLLHTIMWEEGAKRKIKADAGRAHYNPLTGLYLSICSNVPNIILAILILVGYIFGSMDGSFQMEWAGNMYTVACTIARLWEAMYLGLIQLFSPQNPIGFTLIVLPSLFTCTASYYLGLREFQLKNLFKLKEPSRKK
jgi:hypothetical protein